MQPYVTYEGLNCVVFQGQETLKKQEHPKTTGLYNNNNFSLSPLLHHIDDLRLNLWENLLNS
jgi:hypothetical protein